MPDLSSDLLRANLFRDIDVQADALTKLRLKPLEVAALDELFVQGARGDQVYFLTAGRLLAVHWTRDGREVLFGRIERGGCVGDIAALDGGKRSLTVYAQKDSRIIAMPREDYLGLLKAHPDLSIRVMTEMAKLVRVLTQRAYQYTTMNVEERVRRYIARLAMESRAFHCHGVITNAPTHSEIASLIGSNREAVSRAISALKKNGTIAGGRGRIRLIDPDILLKDIVN